MKSIKELEITIPAKKVGSYVYSDPDRLRTTLNQVTGITGWGVDYSWLGDNTYLCIMNVDSEEGRVYRQAVIDFSKVPDLDKYAVEKFDYLMSLTASQFGLQPETVEEKQEEPVETKTKKTSGPRKKKTEETVDKLPDEASAETPPAQEPLPAVSEKSGAETEPDVWDTTNIEGDPFIAPENIDPDEVFQSAAADSQRPAEYTDPVLGAAEAFLSESESVVCSGCGITVSPSVVERCKEQGIEIMCPRCVLSQ